MSHPLNLSFPNLPIGELVPIGKKCICGGQNLIKEYKKGHMYYICLNCRHEWWEKDEGQPK